MVLLSIEDAIPVVEDFNGVVLFKGSRSNELENYYQVGPLRKVILGMTRNVELSSIWRGLVWTFETVSVHFNSSYFCWDNCNCFWFYSRAQSYCGTPCIWCKAGFSGSKRSWGIGSFTQKAKKKLQLWEDCLFLVL